MPGAARSPSPGNSAPGGDPLRLPPADSRGFPLRSAPRGSNPDGAGPGALAVALLHADPVVALSAQGFVVLQGELGGVSIDGNDPVDLCLERHVRSEEHTSELQSH